MRFRSLCPLVALMTCVGVAAFASACGSSSDEDAGGGGTSAEGSGSGGFDIVFIPPVSAIPSIQALDKAIRLKGESLGMSVRTLGGEFDPKVQVSAVQTAISSKVDAILIWPIDPNGLAPVLSEAKDAGIKVLVTDSPTLTDQGLADVNFQEDLEGAAKEVAAESAKLIGEPCKVGILMGVPTVDVLRAKNDGLKAGAEAAGCEVLATQINQKDTTDSARPIVDGWKAKFGDEMTGILSYNDASALAAVSAVDDSFQPLIAGMNGEPDAIEEMKAGRIAVDAEFQAPEVGNGMAQAAYDLLSGESVPPTIRVDAALLTKNDIGDYQSWADRLKEPQDVGWPEKDGEPVLTVQQ
jgi:ABC-type sugar transport system substrate-binding protein